MVPVDVAVTGAMSSSLLSKHPLILTPSGSGSIVDSVGRRGLKAMQCDDLTQVSLKYPAALQTFICGMAMSTAEEGSRSSAQIVEGFDGGTGGTRHVRFGVDTNGHVTFALNTTVTLTGTATVPSTVGAYWHLEIKCKIGNAGTGQVFTYINGVSDINDSDQDTQNGGSAQIDTIALANQTTSYYRMDIWWGDTAGSAPHNDVQGDTRVDVLSVTGNGATNDFTSSSGGANYTNVDDATTSDTDYNYSATVGHIELYDITNAAALSDPNIIAVCAFAAFLKSDAGARSGAVRIKSGSTSQSGTSTALVSGASVWLTHMMELNPDTASGWTETTVNALQVGGTITA